MLLPPAPPPASKLWLSSAQLWSAVTALQLGQDELSPKNLFSGLGKKNLIIIIFKLFFFFKFCFVWAATTS